MSAATTRSKRWKLRWRRCARRCRDAPAAVLLAASRRCRHPGVCREAGGGRPGGEGRGGRPDFAKIPDELRVEIDDRELRVDDGERVRIYYLDGKKHKRELENGMKLETVSAIQGNAVVVEEKMERGKIDRKFELSPDGDTMIATLTVKLGPMKDPVVIKTVYVRVQDAN